MTHSEDEKAAKAWRQRNSDGRNTFNGERTQDPPAFDLVESALPLGTVRITPDVDGEQGHAVRHGHVFDEALEPSVQGDE